MPLGQFPQKVSCDVYKDVFFWQGQTRGIGYSHQISHVIMTCFIAVIITWLLMVCNGTQVQQKVVNIILAVALVANYKNGVNSSSTICSSELYRTRVVTMTTLASDDWEEILQSWLNLLVSKYCRPTDWLMSSHNSSNAEMLSHQPYKHGRDPANPGHFTDFSHSFVSCRNAMWQEFSCRAPRYCCASVIVLLLNTSNNESNLSMNFAVSIAFDSILPR